jgi:hypothetical protein
MLVHDKEAKQMYCPFKFSRTGWAETGKINQEWTCEGLRCMAWQKVEMRVSREGGYCGLAGKPSNIEKE